MEKLRAQGLCGTMTRIVGVVLLGIFFMASSVEAFWGFGQKSLLTLNGREFTKEDFLKFWEQWKEEDSPAPSSPDFWVDWLLYYQEAEQMELDKAPAVVSKLATFLKVRALMQLRQEEVLDKIGKLSEEEVWQRYVKQYTPLYKLDSAVFGDEKEAALFEKTASESPGSFADAVAKAGVEWKTAPAVRELGWLRREKIPELYREPVVKAENGALLGPYPWEQHGQKQYIYIRKLAEKSDDKEDFARLRKDIEEDLFKERDGQLTGDLLRRLIEQYGVEVNKDVVVALPREGGTEELFGQKVITMRDGQSVTAGQLWVIVMRDLSQRYRPNAEGKLEVSDEVFEDAKRRLVNDYIGQTLTVQAALDKHYEKHPPLKDIYDFYRGRRMTIELKNRLFQSKVNITDEMAKAYYEANKEAFTKPAAVEVALMQTKDGKLADLLKTEMLSGKDFFEVSERVIQGGVKPSMMAVNELPSVLQKAVANLAEGDRVGPVKQDEDFYFMKLIRRQAASVQPFDDVKNMIVKKLHAEEVQKKETAFLAKLRGVSTIKLNDGAWDEVLATVKEQIEEAKKQKEQKEQKEKPAGK